MSWQSVQTSSALTLTGSFQTIQQSAADMVTQLSPGEEAVVQLDFNPQASPTDDCEFKVLTSPDDGTTWDVVPFIGGSISFASDPNVASFIVRGCERFKIQARVIKPSGAASADTTSSVTARIRKNGVSI
jgi:hypothetical protein